MKFEIGDIVELMYTYPILTSNKVRGIIIDRRYKRHGGYIIYRVKVPHKFLSSKYKYSDCIINTIEEEMIKIK